MDIRDSVDIVEIVTWNDYGESHYLRDPGTDSAQPKSEAWVDGFSHAGWLDMTAYYARAFKAGALPPVDEDKLYMWARPHTRDADAPDGIGKPQNFELVRPLPIHPLTRANCCTRPRTFSGPSCSPRSPARSRSPQPTARRRRSTCPLELRSSPFRSPRARPCAACLPVVGTRSWM